MRIRIGSRLLNLARRARADESGVAAIEAAAVMPFMVVMAAGVIEYGSMMYQFDLVQTGVRDAARFLARVPAPEAAEAEARRIATTGSLDPSQPLRVKGWTGDKITFAYETTANPRDPVTGQRQYRGGDTITVIRVSTAFSYQGIGLLQALGFTSVPIAAAHEERHVGQ